MSEKIKVGIWGLGRAGNGMHMGELLKFPDKFEIVAACDLCEGQIAAAKKTVPNAKYYTDPKLFLADPEIELISVATRSPDHVSHAIEAFKAGKKVMCEKPVAATVAEIEKLAAAEKSRPGSIFIRHNRRFEPAFNHAREIIASGKLGNVYEIKLCRHSFQWRADWQTLLDCGGGQLLNWGPHLIDQALQLLDAPVAEIWSDLKLIAAKGDAEDHIKIIFKGTNQRVVDVEISGGVAIPDPVYVIHGSRGTLMSFDEIRWKLKYMNPAVPLPQFEAERGNPDGFAHQATPVWIEDDLQVAPGNNEAMWKIWGHLYDTIRLGKPYPIRMEEAVAVVRVTEQVKRGIIADFRSK